MRDAAPRFTRHRGKIQIILGDPGMDQKVALERTTRLSSVRRRLLSPELVRSPHALSFSPPGICCQFELGRGPHHSAVRSHNGRYGISGISAGKSQIACLSSIRRVVYPNTTIHLILDQSRSPLTNHVKQSNLCRQF